MAQSLKLLLQRLDSSTSIALQYRDGNWWRTTLSAADRDALKESIERVLREREKVDEEA